MRTRVGFAARTGLPQVASGSVCTPAGDMSSPGPREAARAKIDVGSGGGAHAWRCPEPDEEQITAPATLKPSPSLLQATGGRPDGLQLQSREGEVGGPPRQVEHHLDADDFVRVVV